MKAPVCKVCGHIVLNGVIPEKCPVCFSPKTAFEEKDDAIKEPQDPNNLTDPEKKHTPKIVVVKECGLISDSCKDVHVKVGEIQHPMQAEHFIGTIDFYINNEYISRIQLTPEKVNPAGALHLNVKEGKITAVSSCNVHGCWKNEADL